MVPHSLPCSQSHIINCLTVGRRGLLDDLTLIDKLSGTVSRKAAVVVDNLTCWEAVFQPERKLMFRHRERHTCQSLAPHPGCFLLYEGHSIREPRYSIRQKWLRRKTLSS